MSMLYGNTEVLDSSQEVLILKRSYLGEFTIIVLCKDPKGCKVELSGAENMQLLAASGTEGDLTNELRFSGRGYIFLGQGPK